MANVDEISRRIVLCPTNEDCKEVNRDVLERVDGAQMSYTAVDTMKTDDPDEEADFPTEFLNSLEPDGLPPCRLMVEVGVHRDVAKKSRSEESTLQRYKVGGHRTAASLFQGENFGR